MAVGVRVGREGRALGAGDDGDGWAAAVHLDVRVFGILAYRRALRGPWPRGP